MQSKQDNSSDEIDLGVLILKITKSISKHKLMMIISILVGIGIGFGIHYSQTPKYESDMIIQSNILTEAYSNTLTETLERLIKEENIDLISNKLSLNKDQASSLSGIKVESITETQTTDDITENRIFKIHVEITNNGVLNDLQRGLIAFLENNEYVKKRVELTRSRLKNLISKVGTEIKEIDSLKSKISKGLIQQQSGNNNLVILDPTTVYSKALSLYKEEISYQQSLELSNSIQLIEGFVAFQKPASPKLSINLVIGFMLGLFFAIGFIIFNGLRTYLRKLDQEMTS